MTGPSLIQNNYLSGSGMEILTGGHNNGGEAKEDSTTDLTIRGNYMFKPNAWRTALSDPGGGNDGLTAKVKNHLRYKKRSAP